MWRLVLWRDEIPWAGRSWPGDSVRLVEDGSDLPRRFNDSLRDVLLHAQPDDMIHLIDVREPCGDDGSSEPIAEYGDLLVGITAGQSRTGPWRKALRRLLGRSEASQEMSRYWSVSMRALDLAAIAPQYRPESPHILRDLVQVAIRSGLRLHARPTAAPSDGSGASRLLRPLLSSSTPSEEVIPDTAVGRRDLLPRHILVLSWRCPWNPHAGGAEVMLLEHMRRWVRQGHAVTLLCPRFPGAARRETIEGMHIVRAGGRFTVYPWAALLYLVRYRFRVDTIVDIENGIPFFSPLYARKPIVCLLHHVHQRQFLIEFGPCLGRLGRFLEGRVMPLLYRNTPFVVVSESTREDLVSLGVDREHIRIVHNGVDHDAYGFPGGKSERPRLLYLGRLKRQKRIDLLLEMCDRLRVRIPEVVLDIVGVGDDEPRLRDLVKQLQLDRHVIFHGFVSHEDKVRLYTQSWALLSASEREGWGLTTMEAAACGTPTICLDVPGLRDAVRNGTSGWIARDESELYEATLRLLQDGEWRSHLSRGARARASQFTWGESAEAGRDAVIDARLAYRGVLTRRRLEEVQTVTMIHRRDKIPHWAWPLIAKAVASQLRSRDSVRAMHDGLSIDVVVGATPDVDAVGRRVSRTIGRFVDLDWPSPATGCVSNSEAWRGMAGVNV